MRCCIVGLLSGIHGLLEGLSDDSAGVLKISYLLIVSNYSCWKDTYTHQLHIYFYILFVVAVVVHTQDAFVYFNFSFYSFCFFLLSTTTAAVLLRSTFSLRCRKCDIHRIMSS